MVEIMKEDPSVIYMVSGEIGNPVTQECRDILKEVEDRVIFLPSLNQKEMARVYNVSSVFVMSSLNEAFGMVPIEDELIVTEELDGWVKVNIEEGDGYVSTDFVNMSTEFVKAESIEEERARLAKEEAARAEAKAAAARKAAENKASSGSSSSGQTTTYAPPSGSASGQAVVDFAMQFVGNPYVYGGTSLTNGADCS